MVYRISDPQRDMTIRQFLTAICLSLLSLLYMAPKATQADIVVDSFTDAIPTPPDSYRSIVVTGVVPPANPNSGIPPVETGLSGVIGGSRMTTLTRTSGIGGTSVLIGANPGQLNFETGPGVGGNVQLFYNNNGAGLAANVTPFLGISIPLLNLDLGTASKFQAEVTLNDGTNSATGTATTNVPGAQELPIIPPEAFAGIDFTNIQSILLEFSFLLPNDQEGGAGYEFDLGAVRILTPEPLAILGWSVVLVMGLVGWRFLGSRVRAA